MLFLYLSLIDTDEEKSKFELLYYKYREMMYYKALSILHDDYLAQDAVQDAFVKILKNMDKINDISCDKIVGTIVIIVRHTAIDLYRKRKIREHISLDDERNYKYHPSYEPNMLQFQIAEYLEKMPNNYREVIELKYTYGYTYKEIGKILGIKTQTVGMRLNRGRKLLQMLIEGSDLK